MLKLDAAFATDIDVNPAPWLPFHPETCCPFIVVFVVATAVAVVVVAWILEVVMTEEKNYWESLPSEPRTR